MDQSTNCRPKLSPQTQVAMLLSHLLTNLNFARVTSIIFGKLDLVFSFSKISRTVRTGYACHTQHYYAA